MAKLRHIWENNKPDPGKNVIITLRLGDNNKMYLGKDTFDTWVELILEDYDKAYLLRILLRDFLKI